VLDKTGSLPVSFPVKIICRIVSYRIVQDF